jgi:hypothetical protein
MEGVRRGPPNAVRHHGEEKEEEEIPICLNLCLENVEDYTKIKQVKESHFWLTSLSSKMSL